MDGATDDTDGATDGVTDDTDDTDGATDARRGGYSSMPAKVLP